MNHYHLCLAFRECAKAFERAAAATGAARALIQNEAAKEAGALLRQCGSNGLLSELVGLRALIDDWQRLYPSCYLQCDENLFYEFVGPGVEFDEATGKVGNSIPGIVQQIAPALFRPKATLSQAQSVSAAKDREALVGEYDQLYLRWCVMSCDVMAEYLESSNDQLRTIEAMAKEFKDRVSATTLRRYRDEDPHFPPVAKQHGERRLYSIQAVSNFLDGRGKS